MKVILKSKEDWRLIVNECIITKVCSIISIFSYLSELILQFAVSERTKSCQFRGFICKFRFKICHFNKMFIFQETNKHVFIVMKYYALGDFETFLKINRKLDEKTARIMLEQIGSTRLFIN
jgi:hypothetical protein